MDHRKPPYKYQKLEPSDSIRILELSPAPTYLAPLQACLIHTPSVKPMDGYDGPYATPYEAVSYTWGIPDFTYDLECSGHNLHITANVNDLLRRLRKSTDSRFLWIDSICINQNDNEEKGIQIALMGDIYRLAQKVQVWLGEENDGDHIRWVFAFIREMARPGKETLERSYYNESLLEGDTAQCVDRFLSRPWFRRRWILQEVALGCDITIRCGALKLSWKWLVDGLHIVENHPLTQRRSLSATSQQALQTVMALNSVASDALDLLLRFHNSECTLPSDRLYALLGMTSGPPRIPVNVSIPWPELYHQFAIACVQVGHLLTLLQHVIAFGPLSKHDKNAASWVPNWNSNRASARRFATRESVFPLQDCTVSSEAPNEISCTGILVGMGEICDISEPVFESFFQEPSSSDRGIDFVEDIVKLTMFSDVDSSKNDEKPHPLAQILGTALLDTLFCFDIQERSLPILVAAFPEILSDIDGFVFTVGDLRYYDMLRKLVKSLDEAINLSRSVLINDRLQSFKDNGRISGAASILRDYNLFILENSAPGISRCNIKKGDIILKVSHANDQIVPESTVFIVRPTEDDCECDGEAPRRFRFVGLCHIPFTVERWPPSRHYVLA